MYRKSFVKYIIFAHWEWLAILKILTEFFSVLHKKSMAIMGSHHSNHFTVEPHFINHDIRKLSKTKVKSRE